MQKQLEKKHLDMKTWEDVYKLPFKLDEYGGVHVFDAKNVLVFQFDEEVLFPDLLVKVINNQIESHNEPNLTYDQQSQFINLNDEPFISIRGYGYLTGTGGLKLSHKEAANIQDTFAQYIICKLNPS